MRYRFMRFPNGKEKALTFSYDDGVNADIRFAELLSKYNLKGTFNINGQYVRDNTNDFHLSREQIQENIVSKGHEIAIHGEYHIAPGNVPAKDGIADALLCRRNLENAFAKIIRGMAYPDSGITRMKNGACYDEIKSYLKMLGIVYSRTLGGDNNSFEMPNDWYAWMPTAHHNNSKLFEYLDEFITLKIPEYHAACQPKLFYLWGHSYEFDNDNSWDRIEEFCKMASGNENIWYATNIEIYDYTNAYNSLIFSSDNTLVYNPTLIDVWFWADGKVFKVESGKTLKIV